MTALLALLLSWKCAATQPVFFRIYEQAATAPVPHWTNRNGLIYLEAEKFTRARLTNGWTLVGQTERTSWVIKPVNDGRLHLFRVSAVDRETLIESD